MNNFILIGVCILSGFFLRKANAIHPEAHKGINTWVLNLALPAVSFRYLPEIELTKEILFPVITIYLVVFVSIYFMKMYCRRQGYSRRSESTMILASGYSNTSFIGFPLVTAFFGEEYLAIAVICDQTMFMALSTSGMITALKGRQKGNKKIRAAFILKRLLTFPPFIACVTALVLSRFIDFTPTAPFFGMLATTVAPMALFSVGLQLKFKGWKKLIPQISISLLFKLLLAPTIITGAALLIGIKGDIPKITIFEMAMPTLITSSIIAEQFGLNTNLINLIIGVGIIVAFATLFLWYPAVQFLF